MSPEEVEVAADVAVARFRARDGRIPEPPALGEIPARVSTTAGPAPGRYCPPAICWCGACEHWTPAPPPPYWSVPGSLDHARTGGRPTRRRRAP